MILLDTHVWVWWVQGDSRLASQTLSHLDENSKIPIGVHIISCWEVAMLSERKRLQLPCKLDDWLRQALSYPGIRLVHLTKETAVDSCRLPGTIHKDPADRMLIAAARALDCRLLTADERILAYSHVEAMHPKDLPELSD